MTFKEAKLATWGEEDIDSNDQEEKDEEVPLHLMALDNDINEVYESNLSCSNDDDIDYFYHELYDSLVKAKRDLKSKIAKNDVLFEKIDQLDKEKPRFECAC